jgi:hypothetical protein
MAQPPEYLRQFNFQNYQEETPDKPLPGDEHDGEYNTIKVTLDAIAHNLALIQRDDGQLMNESVGREQLQENIMLGFNAPEPWVTNHDYTTLDTVFESGKFYLCEIAHHSGIFATDLAAGRWKLIADMTGVIVTETDLSAAETGVVAAATTLIGASATFRCLINGSTAITAFDAVPNLVRFLRFSNPVKIHHNDGSLILPGGYDIDALVGDQAIFVSDGVGNWRLLHFQRADGAPPGGFVSVEGEEGAIYPAFPVGTTERYGVFANGFTHVCTRSNVDPNKRILTASVPGAFLRLQASLASNMKPKVWGPGINNSSVFGSLIVAVAANGNSLTMANDAASSGTGNCCFGTDYASDFPERIEAIRVNSVNPDITIIWPPGNFSTSLNLDSEWSGTERNPARMHFLGTDFYGIIHFTDGVSHIVWSGTVGCFDRFGVANTLRAGPATLLNPSVPGVFTPIQATVNTYEFTSGIPGLFDKWPIGAMVNGWTSGGDSHATIRRNRGKIVSKRPDGSAITLDSPALVSELITISGHSNNVEVGTVFCKDEVGANYANPGRSGRGMHIVQICDFRFDRLIVENCEQTLPAQSTLAAVWIEQGQYGRGFRGNEIWVQNARTHAVYLTGLDTNIGKIRVDGSCTNGINPPTSPPVYLGDDGIQQSSKGTGIWFWGASGWIGEIEVRQKNDDPSGSYQRAIFFDQTGRTEIRYNEDDILKIDYVHVRAGSPTTGAGAGVHFGESAPVDAGAVFTSTIRVSIDTMTVVLPEGWFMPLPTTPLVSMAPTSKEGYIQIGVLNFANPQTYLPLKIIGAGSVADKRTIDVGVMNVYDFVDTGSVISAIGSGSGEIRLKFGDINVEYNSPSSYTASAFCHFAFIQHLHIASMRFNSVGIVGSQVLRVEDSMDVIVEHVRTRRIRGNARVGVLSFARNTKVHVADVDLESEFAAGSVGVGTAIQLDTGFHGDYAFEGISVSKFEWGIKAEAGATFFPTLGLSNSRQQGVTFPTNLTTAEAAVFNQNYLVVSTAVVVDTSLDNLRVVPDARFSSFVPLKIFSVPGPLQAVHNWNPEAHFDQTFNLYMGARNTHYQPAPGDLFVGPNGSDSNSGSNARDPKKTVTAALAAIGNGASMTVWVLPGHYEQVINHKHSSNEIFGTHPRPAKVKAIEGMGSVYFYGPDKQPWDLTWTADVIAGSTDVYSAIPTGAAGGSSAPASGTVNMVLYRYIDPATGLYEYVPLVPYATKADLVSAGLQGHGWAQDIVAAPGFQTVYIRYKGIDVHVNRMSFVFIYLAGPYTTLESTRLYFKDLIFVGWHGILMSCEDFTSTAVQRPVTFFTNCHSRYGISLPFRCTGGDMYMTNCQSLDAVLADGISYGTPILSSVTITVGVAGAAEVTSTAPHTLFEGARIQFESAEAPPAGSGIFGTIPSPLAFRTGLYYARLIAGQPTKFNLSSTPTGALITVAGPSTPAVNASIDSFAARGLEVDCVSSNAGASMTRARVVGLTGPNLTLNGSSMHEGGTIIRVNGRYENNGGPNVADANFAGMTCWSWMVGCWIGDPWVRWASSGTAPYDIEAYMTTGHAWVDTTYSGGMFAKYGLNIYTSMDPSPVVKAYRTNFTGQTAAVVGTVLPYVPATP